MSSNKVNCFSVSRKGVFPGIEAYMLKSHRGEKNVVTLGRGAKNGRYVMINIHSQPRLSENDGQGTRVMEAGMEFVNSSRTPLLSGNMDNNEMIIVKVQACAGWEFDNSNCTKHPVVLEQGRMSEENDSDCEALFAFEPGGALVVHYRDGYIARVSVSENGQVVKEWMKRPAPKTTTVATLEDLYRIQQEATKNPSPRHFNKKHTDDRGDKRSTRQRTAFNGERMEKMTKRFRGGDESDDLNVPAQA